MPLKGFNAVMRAGWMVSALVPDERTKRQLVAPDCADQEVNHSTIQAPEHT